MVVICGFLALGALPGPAPAASDAAPEPACHPAAPEPAPQALPATVSAGQRDTLARLCDELRRLLAGRTDLQGFGGDLELQLLSVSERGFTLRLSLTREGQTLPGPALSLTTTDSGRASATAVRQLAGYLMTAGPLPPRPLTGSPQP